MDMKKMLLMLAVAGASLCSCERHSVDSQVRNDEPTGTIDADQDDGPKKKADSAETGFKVDSLRPQPR